MTELNWRFDDAERKIAISRLTGAQNLKSYPGHVSDSGGGGKFTPAGAPLSYPGNTFICHVDRSSEFYAALGSVQDGLRSLKTESFFAFLPKPSFHMTVFCGVSGSPLGADGWPSGFEANSSLQSMNSNYLEKVRNWTGPTHFNISATGMSAPGTVAIAPHDDQTRQSLAAARERLQELTGIYRSDITSYEFHISLAYQIGWLSTSDAEFTLTEIEKLYSTYLLPLGQQKIGPIEFCQFESMLEYHPITLLENSDLSSSDAVT